MTAALALPLDPMQNVRSVETLSRGSGEDSNYSSRRLAEEHQILQESNVLGLNASWVRGEVSRVYDECKSSNWDGYRAEPVTAEAREIALNFLSALPLVTPPPSVGAEPDGHITLEWYKSPRQTLSVSISPSGHIYYAALVGSSKQYGSQPFYGLVPREIIHLIERIEAA